LAEYVLLNILVKKTKSQLANLRKSEKNITRWTKCATGNK